MVFKELENRYTLSAELLVAKRYSFWIKELTLLYRSGIYIEDNLHRR